MHSFALLSLLTGASLASPLGDTSQHHPIPRETTDSTITIAWEKDLVSGELATSAWGASHDSEKKKALLGFSCTPALTVGGQHISFVTNEDGAGTIQIGSEIYQIGLDTTGAGAGCSRQL